LIEIAVESLFGTIFGTRKCSRNSFHKCVHERKLSAVIVRAYLQSIRHFYSYVLERRGSTLSTDDTQSIRSERCRFPSLKIGLRYHKITHILLTLHTLSHVTSFHGNVYLLSLKQVNKISSTLLPSCKTYIYIVQIYTTSSASAGPDPLAIVYHTSLTSNHSTTSVPIAYFYTCYTLLVTHLYCHAINIPYKP